jgi:hypothetical protein
MERHPQLFSPTGYPTVGDGWRDLLDRALARIAAAVAREGGESEIKIAQIKEKYGTLRLYFDGSKLTDKALAKVHEAIDLAEARSACTCEECGAEGRLYDRGGWYLTRCPDHATGEQVRTKPGWDNLRVVRTVGRGKLRIASCRRYDRERDIFVEAPLPPEES